MCGPVHGQQVLLAIVAMQNVIAVKGIILCPMLLYRLEFQSRPFLPAVCLVCFSVQQKVIFRAAKSHVQQGFISCSALFQWVILKTFNSAVCKLLWHSLLFIVSAWCSVVCITHRFAVRNGPFHGVKRAVPSSKTARFILPSVSGGLLFCRYVNKIYRKDCSRKNGFVFSSPSTWISMSWLSFPPRQFTMPLWLFRH